MSEGLICIQPRVVPSEAVQALSGLHPVLRRIYAGRLVQSIDELDRSLGKLPSFNQMKGIQEAVSLLVEAIEQQWRILVVADYDADGATSCAVALRGLRMLGARQVDYLVPDRFEYGYGLTPEIVELALTRSPDLIVTVDNGISSLDGVEAARNAGCHVLITDHHLPGEQLPDANVIVNPNQPGDVFPSKSLAGVGVMFYLLMALRAHLRKLGQFDRATQPNLGNLLDIVALGTVADVVPLDSLNRRFVHQGLQRIRVGQCCAGIQALLRVAGREIQQIQSSDLGFAIGPRLNAAGRLESMSLGIECLLTDDPDEALVMAQQLDALNQERRAVESQMQDEAFSILNKFSSTQSERSEWGVCLYEPNWHQGVIGILASRVKQRLHRPVIAFAASAPGELKGSARSIEGLHIRDVLDDIAATHPQVLKKFGGHAMAAGLSLLEAHYALFCGLFDMAVKRRLNDVPPDQIFRVDGELSDEELNLDFAQQLRDAGPWGQGFPEPSFTGKFQVIQIRVLQNKHLKFVLKTSPGGRILDGIAFQVDAPDQWVGREWLRLVYRLDINQYQGRSSLQLMIDHIEKA